MGFFANISYQIMIYLFFIQITNIFKIHVVLNSIKSICGGCF